jgi:hypothetical protein
VSIQNDNDPGAKGRAIAHLTRWIKSGDTVRALEAMHLLDLDDADLEALFRDAERQIGKVIPFMGRVR